jgi:hypothetical protein
MDDLKKLRKKAIEVWVKYGQAIAEKWNIRKGLIAGEPLVFDSNDPEAVKDFIRYIEERISNIKKLK